MIYSGTRKAYKGTVRGIRKKKEMKMTDQIREIDTIGTVRGKVLGQRVEYPKRYAPEILVGIERSEARKAGGIDTAGMKGCDAWHAYEVSCLTESGMPTTGVMKIVVSSDTPRLVESKSLKLYLNSLNEEIMGRTVEEAIETMAATVRKDVGRVVGGDIDVYVHRRRPTDVVNPFEGYEVMEDNPEGERTGGVAKVCTHLLRSNCPVTFQPDWGSMFVRMSGNRLPSNGELLRYVVSLRGENHFREEICEQVFSNLMKEYKMEELTVTCVYTRRGGIDICPTRTTDARLMPEGLGEAGRLTEKLFRQ